MKHLGDHQRMSPPSAEAFAELEERVRRLEARIEQHHGPALQDHAELLVQHERQLSDLQEALRETRRHLENLSVQVGRLSDYATEHGLGLHRVDVNVKRLLELLEGRTVIVGATRG